jgi:ADP-ribosylglycohydrolase
MIGAIAGDIIGSVYEFHNIKSTDFGLFSRGSTFTDDTVMTIAVADCVLHGGDYSTTLRQYGRYYPRPMGGYGSMFSDWLAGHGSRPYNSYGNGSAMRVSPVGFAFSTLEETLAEARRSAEITHSHPEGIKGAQAVAAAIFLARQRRSKEDIKQSVTAQFHYNLDQTVESIRPNYCSFDATCQGSVPQAIVAFLDSNDFEDAIRKAVSLGGDSDTIACITGGIAQAFYGVIPPSIVQETRRRLDKRLLAILDEFAAKYGVTDGEANAVRPFRM